MELKAVNNIVKQFIPSKDVKTFSLNKQGLINQTFVVTLEGDSGQKFILQSINTSVLPFYVKGLENILLIKKELERSSFPYEFPTPVTDKYICFEGIIWRLFPFIESSCYDVLLDTDMAFEAAKCLGSFYKSLDSCNAKQLHITLPNFHNATFRLFELEEAIKIAKKDRKKHADELIERINSSRKILQKFDKLNAELPNRVAHFDVKINNFLFEKTTNKAKAIIDLDTLMPGTVLSDIGDMIRTFSNCVGEESQKIYDVEADFKIIQNIINGFLGSCQNILTKAEKDNLLFSGKAITLLQCIRFLTDYLNDDNYYRTSYNEQNFIRAKNQWKLFCSLQG